MNLPAIATRFVCVVAFVFGPNTSSAQQVGTPSANPRSETLDGPPRIHVSLDMTNEAASPPREEERDLAPPTAATSA